MLSAFLLSALLAAQPVDAGAHDAGSDIIEINTLPTLPVLDAGIVDAAQPVDAGVSLLNGLTGELTDFQVLDTVSKLQKAVENDDWKAVSALALMLIVWVSRKTIFSNVEPNMLPAVTMVLAMLTGYSVVVASGLSVGKSLRAAFVIGTSAAGSWSLFGKHVETFVVLIVAKVSAWMKKLSPPSNKVEDKKTSADSTKPQ